ncbi:MAG: hypothetical protein ACNA8W_00900 [Bradymonadaceae bacterium]
MTEALVGPSRHGVFRLTAEPAITGVYMDFTFYEDGRAEMRNDQVREGRWAILDNDDIHVFDLDNEPDQFVFGTVLNQNNRLVALELTIPAWEGIPPYRLGLERIGSPHVSLSDIEGRWQSEDTVTNQHGTFTLGIRIGNDGFIEIGIVTGTNFGGFSSGDGHTQTFTSGTTYWVMRPDAEDAAAVAGQIVGQGEDRRIYQFVEVGVGVNAQLEAIAFQAVERFSAD